MLCPVYGHELTPLSCPPQGVSFRSFKGLIILSPYSCYKEMNFDQFAGLSIDVVHVGAGPVNFAAFSRFMADPARQVVLEHVFGVAFVGLCLSHGDCSPGSAFFYVLIVKELQRDTGFLQFFVNVFVVRGLEHHLFLMFIRIDDAVHLIFSEVPHICIMDPFFVGDAENLADRVP